MSMGIIFCFVLFCSFLTWFTFGSHTLAHVYNSLIRRFKEVGSERGCSDTASHFGLTVAVLDDFHLTQAVHEHHFVHTQSSGFTGHAGAARGKVSSKSSELMRGRSWSSHLQTKWTVYYYWNEASRDGRYEIKIYHSIQYTSLLAVVLHFKIYLQNVYKWTWTFISLHVTEVAKSCSVSPIFKKVFLFAICRLLIPFCLSGSPAWRSSFAFLPQRMRFAYGRSSFDTCPHPRSLDCLRYLNGQKDHKFNTIVYKLFPFYWNIRKRLVVSSSALVQMQFAAL